MLIQERNESVKRYISEKLDEAEASSANDFVNLSKYEQADQILTNLIEVKRWDSAVL